MAEIYAIVACSAPSSAFQVSSATGYVRYVSQTAQTAYIAANRTQIIQQVAPMISAAGAGSIAWRAVAGPIGWASIGVTAGLIIAGLLYTTAEVTQVKTNTATYYNLPPHITVGGVQEPAGTILVDGCTGSWALGCTQSVYLPNGLAAEACTGNSPNPPSGWTVQPRTWSQLTGVPPTACYDRYGYAYTGANQAQAAGSTPAVPTTEQVAGYLGSLPSSDPLSPEAQNQPAGTTNPAPTGSSATTDQPVSPGQLPSQVGSAATVPTGSSVVDPNAPPPTPQTQTAQQSATTTTTTNPDGSKTDTQTATVQCNGGQHNARTFGSVLQDHVNVWSSSGLLGTLNLLKNLTWPTTYPTYTLQSTIFGTLSFNFNQWAGVIDALRVLVIAGAGFAAYRIIFIGGN